MNDLIFDSSQLSRQHVQIAQKIQSEPGVTWGIPSIDRSVIPMRGGDVAVLCGRPGHGKTTLLTYLAREEARRIVGRDKSEEETVVFVTWEGTVDMVYMSIVSALGEYSSTDYAWGRVPLEKIEQNVAIRGVMPITMIGLSTARKAKYPPMTLPAILNAIRCIETGAGTPQRKVTLLCLDYLQLIKMLDSGERRDRVAEAIIGVKDLGMELDIPAFVGAQSARRVDDYQHKLPKMNDIQWSSQAEQHTDKLFSMWRPSLTEEPPVGATQFAIRMGNNVFDVNERLILLQMLKQRWDQGRFLFGLHLEPELLRLADRERELGG